MQHELFFMDMQPNCMSAVQARRRVLCTLRVSGDLNLPGAADLEAGARPNQHT